MKKIGVIGAGSWGTALAWLLANNGHEVTLWSVMEDEVKMLNEKREHISKLPGVKLQDTISITTDLEAAMKGKDVLVLAVPSPFTRSTSHMMQPFVAEGQLIVNVAKGVEETTLMTLSEIIEEEIPQACVAVLSGPSHAEEVGKGLPTTCVIGAKDRETAEYLQEIFMSPVFRVYTSPDILGIELGAALKNVIASCGRCGRRIRLWRQYKSCFDLPVELRRFPVWVSLWEREQKHFSDCPVLVVLIVTCASVHSRNRKAGYLMGQGYTMKEAMDEVKMVVEGVYSAKAALSLSEKHHVEMPIIVEVNKVLFEDKKAADAVNELMQRMKKDEIVADLWDKM